MFLILCIVGGCTFLSLGVRSLWVGSLVRIAVALGVGLAAYYGLTEGVQHVESLYAGWFGRGPG